MKYSNILKNSIYCFGMCSNSIKYVDNIKIDTENKTVQNVIQIQDVIQDENKEIDLTKLFQSVQDVIQDKNKEIYLTELFQS
jgi:hypothetical protein